MCNCELASIDGMRSGGHTGTRSWTAYLLKLIGRSARGKQTSSIIHTNVAACNGALASTKANSQGNVRGVFDGELPPVALYFIQCEKGSADEIKKSVIKNRRSRGICRTYARAMVSNLRSAGQQSCPMPYDELKAHQSGA